ncbi:DUF2569 domain-containing protein [Paenibacillus spongiae]|uniref:DUF2569 domain-containing protein n=1 Tax=Paenibacillus spongiae TaxID=2909671 RepID=A0ABY5S212_9BACL|nr:DUF2569 domain-containing protein [Paenibacillus spongiae]UVI27916.1 DUF2569 domain-containing protein [Paenibacillus spongiae]
MPSQPSEWPSATKPANRGNLDLRGLGGWLILAQISLWYALIGSVLYLSAGILPIFAGETWGRLTSPDSPMYDAMWSIIIPFEAIGNGVLIVLLSYVLLLMYRKKRLLVPMVITYFAAVLILSTAGFILAQYIPLTAGQGIGKSLSKLIGNMLTCLIWIPYFLKSVRVRSTFVN